MSNELEKKLQNVVASWDKAPTTIKVMAGTYVKPIIELLTQIVEVLHHGDTPKN